VEVGAQPPKHDQWTPTGQVWTQHDCGRHLATGQREDLKGVLRGVNGVAASRERRLGVGKREGWAVGNENRIGCGHGSLGLEADGSRTARAWALRKDQPSI
jgi:hypothetical protein